MSKRRLEESARKRSISMGDGGKFSKLFKVIQNEEIKIKNIRIQSLETDQRQIIEDFQAQEKFLKKKVSRYKNMARELKSRIESVANVNDSYEMENREIKEKYEFQKIEFDLLRAKCLKFEEENERYRLSETSKTHENKAMKKHVEALKAQVNELQFKLGDSIVSDRGVRPVYIRKKERSWDHERKVLLSEIDNEKRVTETLRSEVAMEKNRSKEILSRSNEMVQSLKEMNVELAKKEEIIEKQKGSMSAVKEFSKKLSLLRKEKEEVEEIALQLISFPSFMNTVKEAIIKKIGDEKSNSMCVIEDSSSSIEETPSKIPEEPTDKQNLDSGDVCFSKILDSDVDTIRETGKFLREACVEFVGELGVIQYDELERVPW